MAKFINECEGYRRRYLICLDLLAKMSEGDVSSELICAGKWFGTKTCYEYGNCKICIDSELNKLLKRKVRNE